MKIGENEYQEPITWQPDTNTMSFQLFDGNGELVRACDAADALNELTSLRETVKKHNDLAVKAAECIAESLIPLILKWDDSKAIEPRKFIINLVESEIIAHEEARQR